MFCVEPIVLVHGGAGNIPDSRITEKLTGVKMAAQIGYKVLKDGGSVLDAVEASIRYMEDDEVFNAGIGSVLNLDGEVEMDASIMVGANLGTGAVTVIKDIPHPISLARLVMEKTPHIKLAGPGAAKFAKEHEVPTVESGCLVTENAQKALDEFKKYGGENNTELGENGPSEGGTVGAVAIDSQGKLAAGTSTGGISGKMVGRCSDSSVAGSGTYADDEVGAVSTTGHGESIAKFCLAHSIVKEMEYGKSADEATTTTLAKMTKRLKNTAGAITLSKNGDIGIGFTTHRMAWAYQKNEEMHFGIEPGEDQTEINIL